MYIICLSSALKVLIYELRHFIGNVLTVVAGAGSASFGDYFATTTTKKKAAVREIKIKMKQTKISKKAYSII